MSWGCPHQIDSYCERLRGACEPVKKGCVLYGKVKLVNSEEEIGSMTDEIQTLDLRPMPPFERHEKIFQVWETLTEGQVLRIINDHDPKPLHYQFEMEQKGKYEWEYEQEGPKDWIVKIRRISEG